jgi:hypothetical protein
MAYNIKDVFYLDTSATITKATGGGGSAQLDLSAYIDPIARGRTKGTGLAIYKVHYSVLNSENADIVAPDDGEVGILTASLQAGLGVGDNATGAIVTSTSSAGFAADNNLLVSAMNYYGPGSILSGAATAVPMEYLGPSKDVPYVIVRDNVCLVYNVDTAKKFVNDATVAVRMECAQITLDQATLNQLLRTQTV